jgi:ABC-type transport system involved in cytochrome c biogenesis permease component|uniref:Cyochrome c1 ABC transporter channel subunit n=1 Tax=Cyanidiaceae sp. MX-AZ01 TaxID=1503164 RepID=A0A060A8M8_9RHOD|nr:cyochrome c1 ABC transporter channel subunit [Cyanidiaceae sp. MX-AZ01]
MYTQLSNLKKNTIIRLFKIEFTNDKNYIYNILKVIVSYLIFNGFILILDQKFSVATHIVLNIIILTLLSIELLRLFSNDNIMYNIYLIKLNNTLLSKVLVIKHITVLIKYLMPLLMINVLSLKIIFHYNIDQNQWIILFLLQLNIVYNFLIINSTTEYIFISIKNESFLLMLFLLPCYITSIILTKEPLNLIILGITDLNNILIMFIYTILLNLFLKLFMNLYLKLNDFY